MLYMGLISWCVDVLWGRVGADGGVLNVDVGSVLLNVQVPAATE